ncbi:unnamed protein product [Adineta steineri]|uniref:Chromo domain-containing protein n=1 Tax=Adineta steineri TaxID=433720 RepID=A0A815TLE3_9BILA|nr:unnamed protein product [Adineta steineri]
MPEDKEAPVYTAEKILLKRIRKGKVEYYIKWKGWAAKETLKNPSTILLTELQPHTIMYYGYNASSNPVQ